MGTIWKKSHKLLLIMAVFLTGSTIIGIPQHTSAENIRENVQEQEAETIINQSVATWQSFMQDPDLSGFRAHVKGVKGVLIFPKLHKGAFYLWS